MACFVQILTMDNKIDQLKSNWDHLARLDPMWAVLTNQPEEQSEWDTDAFFETGRTQIQSILDLMTKYHYNTNSAFDFGCGLGRLTQALKQQFAQVTGIDISQEMLKKARQLAKKRNTPCSFVDNDRFFQSDYQDSFDFGISLITFQHIFPDVVKEYLKLIYQNLKPNGVFVFQMPAYPTGKEAIYQWLRKSALKKVHLSYLKLKQKWLNDDFIDKQMLMQMHGIKQNELNQFLQNIGYRVLKVKEDQSCGPNWKSYLYIVQK